MYVCMYVHLYVTYLYRQTRDQSQLSNLAYIDFSHGFSFSHILVADKVRDVCC